MPEPTPEQQKLQIKAEQLHELEEKLRECHQEEIKNYWRIGALLFQIKSKKLYYYKDTEGNYNWDLWCREFYGSRRTANRYLDLWYIFLHYYKYKMSELEDFHYSRLALAVPLLKAGEAKNREEVDNILSMARSAPSDAEFKKMLYTKDMSLREVQECAHILDFWVICRICGEKHHIRRDNIKDIKVEEDKFK